jgi:hypothetical protein
VHDCFAVSSPTIASSKRALADLRYRAEMASMAPTAGGQYHWVSECVLYQEFLVAHQLTPTLGSHLLHFKSP